ncbi:P-loop containing nucleoside triphosphate hydrolase protein [Lentinula raphanica]|uniref:DNA 3'-5' helicase n=1 Tax=Lentinula raphanica TaxID=153919 RepID=A0AA38P1N2_9AGAR|nr:P-loop containing nucleoside triphosphate hydrolase protein [Lentinula raphanica]
MIPILSALVDRNTWTIVAIPLISLLHDYERRLSTLRIPYHIFKDGHLNVYTTPSLILVSSDLAVRQAFRSAVKSAHAIKPVGRFIYDEGQLAVTDSDYRNPLRDAQEFRCVDAPLIIMTGTAPPPSVPIMAERFGLVSPYLIARGCTDRPELCLILETQRSVGDILSRTVELVNDFLETMANDERIMIFVPTLAAGQSIAECLYTTLYSGDKEITPDRNTIYDDWIAGTHKVIVGTSALYAGNDYPHVRMVIFAGTPGDMTGTFQGITRAGRDGTMSHCYILPTKHAKAKFNGYGVTDYAGNAKIVALCNNTPITCLRFQFTHWCDHAGVLCKDSNNGLGVKCSSCLALAGKPIPSWIRPPVSQIIPAEKRLQVIGSSAITCRSDFGAAVNAAEEYRQKRTGWIQPIVDTFQFGFDLFKGLCTLCNTTWHPLEQCPKTGRQTVKLLRLYLKQYPFPSKEEKKNWGSICFHCHLPQLPGDLVHEEFSRERGLCRHPDFMLGLWLRLNLNKQLVQKAYREVGLKQNDEWAWLVARPLPTLQDTSLPKYVSNFVYLIIWYLNFIQSTL